MKTMTIEVPDDLSVAVGKSEADLPDAFRLAAAIQWYSEGLISQGKGARSPASRAWSSSTPSAEPT